MLEEQLSPTSIVEEPEIVLVSPTNQRCVDSVDNTAVCVPSRCIPYCRITTCQPYCGIIPTCQPVCRIRGPN